MKKQIPDRRTVPQGFNELFRVFSLIARQQSAVAGPTQAATPLRPHQAKQGHGEIQRRREVVCTTFLGGAVGS